MDIGEARRIGRAVVNIHQGILDFHGCDGTDDKVEADGDALRLTLRGVSDFVDATITVDIHEKTTMDDIITAVCTGLDGLDVDAAYDAMIRDGGLDDSRSASRTLHDMEDDGRLFWETVSVLTNRDDVIANMD